MSHCVAVAWASGSSYTRPVLRRNLDETRGYFLAGLTAEIVKEMWMLAKGPRPVRRFSIVRNIVRVAAATVPRGNVHCRTVVRRLDCNFCFTGCAILAIALNIIKVTKVMVRLSIKYGNGLSVLSPWLSPLS